MNIFQPTISGSLYISGAAESGGSGHILTYNTSSGILSYTSSNAIGGGGSGTGFPFSGSAVITGSLLVSQSGIIVSGSVSSTGGFTGSLFGTASYVSGSVFTSTNPALSASNALTASFWGGYLSTSSIIGDDISTTYTITHNFNTKNLHITVYETSSNGETVYPDIRRNGLNTAQIVFANPPKSGSYIVYISQ